MARSPQTGRALAQIEYWQRSYEDSASQPSPDHFRDHSNEQLVRVWLTGRHLDGSELSEYAFGCLCEAWVERFDELPGDDSGSEPYTGPEPELKVATLPYLGIEDGAPLTIKEVAGYMGCTVSTVRRMVQQGRFPEPQHPTPHKIVWRGKDVREYLERIERERQAKMEAKKAQGW